MKRHRLTARQREDLYRSEADRAREQQRGNFPICNICDLAVLPGQTWDESHQKHKPHWLGGELEGVAHTRCNRNWNNQHDTPLFAKSERVRKRFLDIKRSRSSIPGSRNSPFKKRMDGTVERRAERSDISTLRDDDRCR